MTTNMAEADNMVVIMLTERCSPHVLNRHRNYGLKTMALTEKNSNNTSLRKLMVKKKCGS